MSDAALKVAFRVDGGARIGSGHVMRCLTLAIALEGAGAHVAFICREMTGNLIERIRSRGFVVHCLPLPGVEDPSVAAWLQVPKELDAAETREFLERYGADWLVVDHYGIDVEWERAQRAVVRSLLVIDDLADRVHDCDVLLDQSFSNVTDEHRYAGLVPPHCRKLFGPRYALLGREYSRLREVLVPRSGDASRALVFFGGADATNETSKALEALTHPRFEHLSVDVVVGANHPALQRVLELSNARPRTHVFRDLDTLAGLILRADLAIGAGGTMHWERLCLGLPSVVVTVAANQEPQTSELASVGLVHWVGRSTDVSVDSLRSVIERSLNAPMREPWLVDGYGADRVGAVLIPPTGAVKLEPARAQHSELLYHWRNDAQSRAMSFNQAAVEWSTHDAWFRAQRNNARAQILIARLNELPVGQVRLDASAAEGVILSYSVDADFRGRGLGAALVASAVRTRGCAGTFIARVKAANEASRKIFRKLGWSESINGEHVEYRLDTSPSQRDSR